MMIPSPAHDSQALDGSQIYHVHHHDDGAIEIIFTPPGDHHSIAIPLSRMEAQIFEALLLRITDRINPDLQPQSVH